MSKRAVNLLASQLWAIAPDKLEAIAELTERLMLGQATDRGVFAKTAGDEGRFSSYEVVDGVAVIAVDGVIAFRMNLFDAFSGGTSTQIIGRRVRQAARDPEVRAIVLDIDSPGGTVGGLCDLSAEIRTAREVKPVVSWTGCQMCSGAYWLGSAATEIISAADAAVGSLGVAYVHYDRSAKDEKDGVKRTILSAGKFKRIAHDAQPLSEEGEAYLQGQIDDYFTLFVEDVASNLGASVDDVLAGLADGSVHVGEKALARGFVHSIGSRGHAFERALALAENFNQEAIMSTGVNSAGDTEARGDGFGAPHVSISETQAEAQAETATAIAEAMADGVQQERQRVLALLAVNGDREMTTQAIKDGTDRETFLQAVLDATRAGQVKDLDRFVTSLSDSAGSSAAESADDPVTAAASRMKARVQGRK